MALTETLSGKCFLKSHLVGFFVLDLLLCRSQIYKSFSERSKSHLFVLVMSRSLLASRTYQRLCDLRGQRLIGRLLGQQPRSGFDVRVCVSFREKSFIHDSSSPWTIILTVWFELHQEGALVITGDRWWSSQASAE